MQHSIPLLLIIAFLPCCQVVRPVSSYELWNNGKLVDPTHSPTVKLNSSRGICSGTLISSSHILTAAHCVYDPRSCRPARNLIASLGGLDFEVQITEDQIHPTYRQECQQDYDEYLRRLDDAGAFGGAERPLPTLHRRRHDIAVVEIDQSHPVTPRNIRYLAIEKSDRWLLVSGFGLQTPRPTSTTTLHSQNQDLDKAEGLGDHHLREGIASIVEVDDFVKLQGPIISQAAPGQVTPAQGDSGGGVYYLAAESIDNPTQIDIPHQPILNGIVTGGRIKANDNDQSDDIHESWVIDFSLERISNFITERLANQD